MNKSSSMRIRLDPELHSDFLTSCRQQDRPAAQVLREFMRNYIARYPPTEQQELLLVAEQDARYK